ncbi:primosomal protein N' [Georgenia subflava]|uniref:Probable replication restart protein PriA n=1 Tax=Georgenia subflava TaxID=1622177 RepID=A0A6N7EL73_9MICO|nr:primosomal protein N' [Georgenia subflava]MPV38191.1 primosomal protein N' [Georgenia subflava]
MTSGSRPEQGALLDLPARAPAAVDGGGVLDPVARVMVDVPLPHLDHPFDYLVPPAMADTALPGARVQVRFAGKDRSAFVIERRSDTDHGGSLAPLRRAVSPVPVLSPAVLRLCRAVADRYAGTLMDVVRLAVPPRHASTEKAVLEKHGTAPLVSRPVEPPTGQAWAAYTGGPAFLRHLGAGKSPRAVWTALPSNPRTEGSAGPTEQPAPAGPARPTEPPTPAAPTRPTEQPAPAGPSSPTEAATPAGSTGPAEPRTHAVTGDVAPWPAAVAQAARATRASGRGVLVVVPTTRQVDLVVAALAAELPGEPVVRLVADDGPSRRYRAFLRVLLGEVRVVVGTRAAAFAPVNDLGLLVCFDDGDDRLAEPRTPYPHARQVLALRAEQESAAFLLGGFARSSEGQLLVEEGWAQPVQASREVVRRATPRVSAPTEVDLAREGAAAAARIPRPAWELARRGLESGPVLVQVARGGYLPMVACARCREPARCTACHGPLRLDRRGTAPTCSWCGRHAVDWSCQVCRHTALRAVRVGSGRTAEELGRAFPSVPVVVSGTTASHGVVETVDHRPRLVVATPGAEPVANGGYAAALLLDGAAATSRPELWASAEALRRWLGAAALVRGAADGGQVMLLGQPAPVPAQALVRWDPAGFAARELAERADLAFPPAVRMASAQGAPTAVRSLLAHLEPLDGLEILGPVDVEDGDVRALLRVERRLGGLLSQRLAHANAARTARKEEGTLRLQVDPPDLW